MEISASDPIRYQVDPEHSGIRMAVVFIFLVIWLVIYLLIHVLTSAAGIDLVALVVGFIVTVVATQQIERRLKQRWPSGREVHISPHQIQLRKKANVEDEIDPKQTVNVLLWHFKVSKRSRVQKGWLVVACALEQEETYIPIYTFMPPELFEDLLDSHRFTALQKIPQDQDKNRPMQLAGIQRRLHDAERMRWLSGAEMTQDGFKAYLATLQEYFPQWMPSVV